MSEIKIPKTIHHSHQRMQMDLGETIYLSSDDPGDHQILGEVYNFDDLPAADRRLAETDCEDIEITTIAIADKIVLAFNCHDALVKALQPFADQPVSDDAPCHFNLTTKEKCGRCSRILAARAAVAKAKGES